MSHWFAQPYPTFDLIERRDPEPRHRDPFEVAPLVWKPPRGFLAHRLGRR